MTEVPYAFIPEDNEAFDVYREAERARDMRAQQRYGALGSSWSADVDPATGLYKRDVHFVEVEIAISTEQGEQA